MQNKTLVVVGGGAAGFFCAVNAARIHKGLKVILLEKSSKLLSKVKISGGGRCNVTHACEGVADLIKNYPRGGTFLKKAFHEFHTKHTIDWFEARGVPLKTESDGRMFPLSDQSQTIIDCLLNEASRYHVDIRMNADVRYIHTVQKKDGLLSSNYQIELANQKTISADFICVACGGFPKESQFEWLQKLGHTIEKPVPSLFTFNLPADPIKTLMGIAVPHTSVKIMGTKIQQEGALLITHWGLSGPAILKLSAWGAIELAERNYTYNAIVNWLPSFNEHTLKEKFQQIRFEKAAQKIYNRNPFFLPARLWEYLLGTCYITAETRWADLPAKEQNKLIKTLCAHSFDVSGKTTFKEEFVTAGGIQLTEVDAGTMQSKIMPGLYFAGEILNIDGVTGGFNFQNAWTTGWIAANGLPFSD